LSEYICQDFNEGGGEKHNNSGTTEGQGQLRKPGPRMGEHLISLLTTGLFNNNNNNNNNNYYYYYYYYYY